jgi:hypothetical protein
LLQIGLSLKEKQFQMLNHPVTGAGDLNLMLLKKIHIHNIYLGGTLNAKLKLLIENFPKITFIGI